MSLYNGFYPPGTKVSVPHSYYKGWGGFTWPKGKKHDEWEVVKRLKCGKFLLKWTRGKAEIHVPQSDLHVNNLHGPWPKFDPSEWTIEDSTRDLPAVHGLDVEEEITRALSQ